MILWKSWWKKEDRSHCMYTYLTLVHDINHSHLYMPLSPFFNFFNDDINFDGKVFGSLKFSARVVQNGPQEKMSRYLTGNKAYYL